VITPPHPSGDASRSLRSGFLRFAKDTPAAPALFVRDVTRSYGELDAAARVWAAAVTSVVGGPAARVGVFGHRSEVSSTAVIAALYLGGLAGDLAASELGMRSMVASDIREYLSAAIYSLDPDGEMPH